MPLVYVAILLILFVLIPVLLATFAGDCLQAIFEDVFGSLILGPVPFAIGFAAAISVYIIVICASFGRRDVLVSISYWAYVKGGRWRSVIRLATKSVGSTAVALTAGNLVCSAVRYGLLAYAPDLYHTSAEFRQSVILFAFAAAMVASTWWYRSYIRLATGRLGIPGNESNWLIHRLANSTALGIVFAFGTFAGITSTIYTTYFWLQLLMALVASSIAAGFFKLQFELAIKQEVETLPTSTVTIFGIGTFAGLASSIYNAIPWVQFLMVSIASAIAGGFVKVQFEAGGFTKLQLLISSLWRRSDA